ncbi:double-stranded RNA binding protein [Striga asiatica]|uniref:Double-stranded RNA binding protein n=1 Tax=Striga asiatica TaxID=4170 RepID=A0A5A7PG74_STRAF|nr:double-stranded RNA binding protein [Striga asiatica]
MHKTKLQELCHKRKWKLPEYATSREGQDHMPLFRASVWVCGNKFDSGPACKSSKQAHNEAAQIAFLHLTSGSINKGSENNDSTISTKQVQSSMRLEDKTAVKNSENLEKQNKFKTKLEMYARKRNLKPPVYREEKVGHLYRAVVSIDDEWFESVVVCETTEEAQDSAAQAALLSLSTDAFRENDPRSYKILLNELAKEEGFFIPVYTTSRCDEAKFQAFSSIVDVEGEIFEGDKANSKKMAELNAAKAAYTVLIERKLFEPGDFLPRFSSGEDSLKLVRSMGSLNLFDPEEIPKSECPPNFSSSMKNEAQIQKFTGEEEKVTDEDCGKKKSNGTKCYLLCNRFKIFTSIPNMVLPRGTVLLPISETMWTIVTLDFPNEN